MKQRWIYKISGIVAAVFFVSCTGFFDLGKEEIINLTPANEMPKTLIYFNNTNNYAVDVFSSHTRGIKVVTVPANQSSDAFSWIPTNDGFEFYFTYYLTVSGKEVPYIPPKDYGVDYITVTIPKDKTTAVQVPRLSQNIKPDTALFTDAFLAIKNNNASAIQLLSGNSIILPVTGLSLVNYGETAVYKLIPTKNISLYSIKLPGNNVALYNSGITTLESGYLYEVEVTGTGISLKGSKLLTLSSL